MSLECFFDPKSIAVVGASPRIGSVGYTILDNLRRKFKRRIYPVNPKYSEILGLKCYPSVRDIEDDVDLAVIAVRAELVPRVMEDCSAKKVKCVIVINPYIDKPLISDQLIDALGIIVISIRIRRRIINTIIHY